MIDVISAYTGDGVLFAVDTRLRPGGRTGMLVVSLDAFEKYQREEAWTWEHMALCRARPVFGSPELQERVGAMIQSILKMRRNAETVIRDASKMRADIERHKPARGPLA